MFPENASLNLRDSQPSTSKFKQLFHQENTTFKNQEVKEDWLIVDKNSQVLAEGWGREVISKWCSEGLSSSAG